SGPIVRAFPRDLYIMHMAFAQTRPCDPDEFAVAPHLFNSGASGIAHGGAQSTDKLMNDRSGRPLIGHLPLDPFRHQLVTGGVLLEITIGTAPCHGAQTAHA